MAYGVATHPDVAVDVRVEKRARPWLEFVRRAGLPLGIALIGLVLRTHTALHQFETIDERLWTQRSTVFWQALSSGELSAASASADGAVATMPGITTMWIGTLSRGAWALGAWLGFWDGVDGFAHPRHLDTFAYGVVGLDVAQVGMALTTSALIALLVVLVSRWVGPVAAGVAGILVATEPFTVAHGAVLHTDELVALFGASGCVAAALALGVPERTASYGRNSTGAVAGALLAGAVLTKLSGLMVVPGVGLLWLWAVVRERRQGPPNRGGLRRVSLAGLAAFLAVVVVAYPALWVDPLGEFRNLWSSMGLAGGGHYQFFRGGYTTDPGLTFYPVALPLRMTPWLLVGAVAGAVTICVRRSGRAHALAIGLMSAPVLVALVQSSKKFDRYGLTLVVFAAIVAGIGVKHIVEAVRSSDWRPLGWIGSAGAAGVALNSLVVSPWGLAYYNPVLGGSAAAERTVMIGWWEGYEQVGDLIRGLAGGRCAGVTVEGYPSRVPIFRCGALPPDNEPADYLVEYVTARQRFPDLSRADRQDRDLVAVVRIRGIDYVRIYGPPSSPTTQPAPPP